MVVDERHTVRMFLKRESTHDVGERGLVEILREQDAGILADSLVPRIFIRDAGAVGRGVRR